MNIKIINSEVNEGIPKYQIYDIGTVTTTLQALLDVTSIIVYSDITPILKITLLDASIKQFLFKNLTIPFDTNIDYITGNDFTVNDLVDISEGTGGGGIQSLSGDLVDNTDPDNPIINTPTIEDLGNTAITKTKTEIDALIIANTLIVGATYEITGVHTTLYNDGTDSGTTIYLQALTSNSLSKNGHGVFWNPKYNQAIDGFNIWSNLSSFAASSVIGTFTAGENITSNNGATGNLFITTEASLFVALTGNWATSTSITGTNSGATANITSVVLKTYSIGSKVIWGGYSWTNINGLVGNKTDILNLNSEWTKNIYSNVNYNKTLDIIEYDYTHDIITRRYEVEGDNEVTITYPSISNLGETYNAISVFMFGNVFDSNTFLGVNNNCIKESYVETVNFRGTYISNNDIKNFSGIKNNTIESGSTFEGNILSNYSIFNNNNVYKSEIYYNILDTGSISNNYFSGQASGFPSNSTISKNIVKDNGRLINNTLVSATFRSNEIIENSEIESNLININCNIDSNHLYEGSEINTNVLKINSKVSNNFMRESFIRINSLESSSLICDNTLLRSYIEVGLLNTFIAKSLSNVNMEFSTININIASAIILFGVYPKTVYRRPDGIFKIRYYNNSDVLVIADLTD